MAKKDKQTDMPDLQRDEALFEALNKNKKRKRRKILITVLSIVLILAVAAVAGVSILQKKVREQFAASSGEVKSHEVTTGSISTVVSGSGRLSDVDQEVITVPDGVEITEVIINTNDTVAEGDILATVDMSSVASAMAQLQAELEDLDEQISDAEDDEADDIIYAGVTGRVKALFAKEGSDVLDVMYEHGALAILSLDGYMAVDIQTEALSAGDSVKVERKSGKKITGTVESVSGNTATVLVTDNGPRNNESVKVYDGDGKKVGSGKLYIHSPLRITGYAGTVDEVKTSLNKKVSSTTKVFTLEDTDYSANYSSLLRSRTEKEEILLELLQIQRAGAVLAPVSGSVYSVDFEEGSTSVATLSLDEKMSVTISVDESDILALELGQEVNVTVSSVSEDAFAGTLTEIDRTSSSSGTYSAVVEIEKTEGMLSDMTASVSVRIEGVDNAILIPVEALHQTRNGAYVYTSYNEELQEYGGKVDVTTGLENSTYVEIKSGLNVGDTVYYTESESMFGNFGGMGNFGGGMPNMGGNGGGGMPDFGSGNKPSGGGNRGGRN